MPSHFPATARRVFAILFLFAATLCAHDEPAAVGVPYTLDFGQIFFGQDLSALQLPPEVDFSYSFALGGGALPPGLSLKSSGLLSGVPTTAGQFDFTMNFTFRFSFLGTSTDYSFPIPYTIVVVGDSGPKVSAEPGGVSFFFTAGSVAASQFISVGNQGPVARDFTAVVSVSSGGDWLTAAGGGTIGSFKQSPVAVTAD